MLFKSEHYHANYLIYSKIVLVYSNYHKKNWPSYKEVNPAYALIDIQYISGIATAKIATRKDYELV